MRGKKKPALLRFIPTNMKLVKGFSVLAVFLGGLLIASHPDHYLRRMAATRISAPYSAGDRPLRVAFAMIASRGMHNSDPGWRQAFAVLSHSIHAAGSRSPNTYEVIAIVPDRVDNHSSEREAFARVGIKAYFVPTPVPLAEVQTAFGREELAKVLGVDEQLKFYGAKLVEYDRVVVLDGDTMVRAPIDELFEMTSANQSEPPQLIAVYDHELDIRGSTFPPVNSGFLVYTPRTSDFDDIVSIYRRGDFRSGTGWMGSGTGWTYGTGSQGILSFYYNQVRPGQPNSYNKKTKPLSKGLDLPDLGWTKQPPGSRFRPLDRSVYNVIDSHNLQKSRDLNGSRVKVFHFTGLCQKPWRDSGKETAICDQMQKEWKAVLAKVKVLIKDSGPALF
eukprot:TRINITY_DN57456_c0_g1_i1.p1 TRINITY_DN57456_c0_g1~~TRINITY_DN57456_c0_g1_i1.p1  ORF type:complete len:390 (+),score=44.04 TRINITY_DN57456_c0_g1_i1:58-1227(+)